jgi:hypothetical protein
VWLSPVEHCVRDAGVAGSNPATPTKISFGFLPFFPNTFKGSHRSTAETRRLDAWVWRLMPKVRKHPLACPSRRASQSEACLIP